MPKKRNHLNFCINPDCKRAFELTNDLDYCERCRITLGLTPGDHADYRIEEDSPEIVREIMKRYMAYGYE
jgi:hypothetical protein